MEWLSEDIVLFWSVLSAVDQVEELQEYEHVEQPGGVSELGGGTNLILRFITQIIDNLSSLSIGGAISHAVVELFENKRSEDQDAEQDKEVPESHSKNLSPYLWSHHLLVVVWLICNHILEWWFCSKSKGSECVHDKVQPKELNS